MTCTHRILFAALPLALAQLSVASDENPITITGWLDMYYQQDFNRPSQANGLFGRAFDARSNSFALANLQTNIRMLPSEKKPYGFALDFSFGNNSEVNSSFSAPSEKTYKNIQQAYGTYLNKDGSTFDFGKFNSWIGYESIYSPDNPNYSIGTLFNYAQPNWHTGLRYTKPLNTKQTLGLYVVNGWNSVDDIDNGKTVGLSLANTLSDKLSATVNYIGGNEGVFPGTGPAVGLSPLESNLQLLDVVSTYKLNPKHTLAFNGNYGSAKANDAGAPEGTFHGFSFYSNQNLSDTRDFSVRYSIFHDGNGARGFAGSIGSLTATYSIKTNAVSTLRFELRNDFANASVFADRGGSSDRRTTLTIAHVIKF
jgi:hypothetical protein